MSRSISIPPNSDFTLANIPFGVYSDAGDGPVFTIASLVSFFSGDENPHRRLCTRLGDTIIDLKKLSELNVFSSVLDDDDQRVFSSHTLNAFAALGREKVSAVRKAIQKALADENGTDISSSFRDVNSVTLHLPMKVEGFTDFLCSAHHSMNMSRIRFGPNHKALLSPQFTTFPIAYNGRASSVVVSGTPITRPYGCSKVGEEDITFHPCRRLDYEVEFGYFIGKESKHGHPVPVTEAKEYIFGAVLVNDWSARDHQGIEMQSLGPFNAKNFGTSISPWVVTMDALEPFKAALPARQGTAAPYLQAGDNHGYDVKIDVDISGLPITTTNIQDIYWSPYQMIAHHTIGGSPLKVGDLLATGTVSGDGSEGRGVGCLMEQTQAGRKAIEIEGAPPRLFLEDGDLLTFHGYCGEGENRVGFGDCSGLIKPVLDM